MKAGDTVLVRNYPHQHWGLNLFSHKVENPWDGREYVCINYHKFQYCIPLEGNEHLVGTKDDIIKDDYPANQECWLKDTGCEVGSMVLLESKAKRGQFGWEADWCSKMNTFVGCYGMVRAINKFGLVVSFSMKESNENAYAYPYFVLKVVRP